MKGSKRRSNETIVKIIINNINDISGSLSIDKLIRETQLGEKTLRKWIDIISFIRIQCPEFSLSAKNDLITQIKPTEATDFDTVRNLSQKKRKDPKMQKFFAEFDTVLSKTQQNLTFAETQLISKEESNPIQRQFDPRLNDLQLELSQVLQKGLSHLTSPEITETGNNSVLNHNGNLLHDLKQAVKLGINGLEHIENVDHKIKKKKLTGWKAELAEAFKEREKRTKSKS